MRSVADAAKELGRTRSGITQALAKMNCPKFANSYVIDDATFDALKSSKGAGRPKGSPNKPKNI